MTLLLLDTTFLIDAERTDAQLDRAIDDADDVAIVYGTVGVVVAPLLVSGLNRSCSSGVYMM